MPAETGATGSYQLRVTHSVHTLIIQSDSISVRRESGFFEEFDFTFTLSLIALAQRNA
jgi:hypothetical protein